jgi:hypothetical protein
VSSNVLNILWREFAWRGAWEEVPPNIEWNEPRTIRLDIFAKHIKHQPQIKGNIIFKKAYKDD